MAENILYNIIFYGVRSKYIFNIGQDGGEEFSADHDRKAAAFISRLNFMLLSWLLQYFGHIQFTNKDAKSAERLFFLIENCDWFLTCHMAVYDVERAR